MDVEFRWLRIHGSELRANHPSAMRYGDTAYFMVLQTREREGPRGEGWWGPWKDIPVAEANE